MTNFGKLQLLKFGWTEGKGLGKDENGILEALKPKLKFDTTGIGHATSEYPWWEFVYNKASDNITINTEAKCVKLNVIDRDSVDIKTSRTELNLGKLKKKKKLRYGNFVKVSTLENGELIRDPNHEERSLKEKKDTVFSVVSDDKLFEACSGRTGHKGARHGLTLLGKLARLEEQDRELEQKLKEKQNATDWIQVKSKRKKEKKNCPEEMDITVKVNQMQLEESIPLACNLDASIRSVNNIHPPQSRKTKRKAKRRLENLTHQLEKSLTLSPDSIITGKNNVNEFLGPEEELYTRTNNLIDSNENEYEIEPLAKKCKKDVMDSSILNSKIEKKKKSKRDRKQRKKIEKLSSNLMVVDLIKPNQTEDKKCKNDDLLIKQKKQKSHK